MASQVGSWGDEAFTPLPGSGSSRAHWRRCHGKTDEHQDPLPIVSDNSRKFTPCLHLVSEVFRTESVPGREDSLTETPELRLPGFRRGRRGFLALQSGWETGKIQT